MGNPGYWRRDYYYETANNRLKSHDGGSDVYRYDEHGNTTAMPHLPSMHWDYRDRLKDATLNASRDMAYYTYDASGERVRKVVEKGHGIVEQRIYMGGWEIYRKTISGTLDFERETLRIIDDRKAIAHIETKTIENGREITPTTNLRYQYNNHLGSACLELDENAAIISYEEYHPFGTTSYRSGRTETEVSLKRYKYVGKERDEETGLYYYGARYYAVWLCRFVSVDPMAGSFPTFSPYAYAVNNPMRYSDPSGMQSEDEVDTVHNPSNGIMLDPVVITAEKPDLQQSDYWDIKPEEFLEGIRANLKDPLSINQGGPPGEGTYFCGFAAFLSYYVENDPEKYSDFMMDLYTTGKATAGDRTFETSQALYDAAGTLNKYEGLADNKANQMMFLTLGENYGSSLPNLFNPDYNTGDEASIWASTTLGEFKTMMSDFGYDVKIWGSDTSYGSWSNNKGSIITEEQNKGNDLFLYANSGVFKENSLENNLTNFSGTHYMRLKNFKKTQQGKYQMDYWDYGNTTENYKMRYNHFYKSVYGIISVQK